MMDKPRQNKKYSNNNSTNYRNTKGRNKDSKERKPMSEQSYRFRRVLGEILKYLKSVPHRSSFSKCQQEFGEQLTELIQRGFTWGYIYSIPTHESDFKALQKKEWAAVRAIVRKQEYEGANPNY